MGATLTHEPPSAGLDAGITPNERRDSGQTVPRLDQPPRQEPHDDPTTSTCWPGPRGRRARAPGTGCTGSDDKDASPTPSASPSTSSAVSTGDSSTCGYLYEWVDTFRFPLQPDPHAAYTYVVPKITDGSVGFEISGSFPYASWTEWMVYTGLADKAQPYSVVKDSAITPDSGSVNPFVPGTPVLSEKRDFRLLVVPDGTDLSTVDASLQDVPEANVLSSPTKGSSFVLANRVYNAFPGYNQGGAAGPTDTPFPTVRAVDLATGEGVDCSSLNLVPQAGGADRHADQQGRTGRERHADRRLLVRCRPRRRVHGNGRGVRPGARPGARRVHPPAPAPGRGRVLRPARRRLRRLPRCGDEHDADRAHPDPPGPDLVRHDPAHPGDHVRPGADDVRVADPVRRLDRVLRAGQADHGQPRQRGAPRGRDRVAPPSWSGRGA